MRFAARMQRLGTERAFEVLARAKQLEAQGRPIVHLEIGEPDFDTPEHIKEAAAQALRDGYTHYGPSPGLPELREAIAEDISRSRGIDVRPSEVVVTPGAKPILFFSILALVDEGDAVIYPDPGFPIYESVIRFVGGEPVPVPLRERDAFRLDADELRRLLSPRTRLVILNSPHNPTGGVLAPEDLQAIAALCLERGIMVLSDEPYCEILYEGRHHSIAAIPGMKDLTILVDGFSKTYAMTGWRLGYGVMPEELAERVARLETNCNSCTAAFVQRAGLAALRGPQDSVAEMVAEFRARRDILAEELNRLPGLRCLRPAGAFYAFPNIEATGLGCRDLAHRLLEEADVALLAGTDFGGYGEGHLRISYATSRDNLRTAVERMAAFLARSGLSG